MIPHRPERWTTRQYAPPSPRGRDKNWPGRTKGSQNKAPDKTRDPADGSGAKGGCGSYINDC
ncbi:hypothetical protein MACH18_32760 [Phaeobacter italicus]|nr:hypothetical protein MACH18_32760 [Phaeobacter italicus]